MTSSVSNSPVNFWAWMFRGLSIYFLFEIGLFLLLRQIISKSVEELAGPFLAFAIPVVTAFPFVWWLRKWEERGVSPRRVALGWGVCMALFVSELSLAIFYSGVELHLVNPASTIGFFAFAVVVGVAATSFNLYRMMLPRISARATRNSDGSPPKPIR